MKPGSGILSQENPWTIAALVSIGGLVITLLIANTSLSSALEAADAFIVLLTGFYYFSQILLLGANLTRIKAERRGSQHPQETYLHQGNDEK